MYFEQFKNGEKFKCVVLLKKISLTLLKEKYGMLKIFLNYLHPKIR